MSLLWAKELFQILYVFLAMFLRVRQSGYRSEPPSHEYLAGQGHNQARREP